MANSREILGGYNPLGWKSDGSYEPTKGSFIFSFNNEDIILSRVMDEYNAIFNGMFNGPSFGNGDLMIRGPVFNFGRNCYCKEKSYEKPIRKTTNNFNVKECEVFQIIQNR